MYKVPCMISTRRWSSSLNALSTFMSSPHLVPLPHQPQKNLEVINRYDDLPYMKVLDTCLSSK